jgi:hypothetical protein
VWVLHCPNGYKLTLDALIENFIFDRVKFIAVVGHDCERVEDIVDELVVGLGDDSSRYILTSSHPDQSVDDACSFARQIVGEEYGNQVEVVLL